MAERVTDSCTLTLLGIGAMASERYAPAGLLIERHGRAIMIDGARARSLTDQWRTGSSQTSAQSSLPRSAGWLVSSSAFGRQNMQTHTLAAGWNHTLGPSMLNELRFGYNKACP